MRIIAGEFGGRRLKAVPGDKTRPTTDKIKEAMFSMLGQYFQGGKALDLYAGSGALAIEAVSRGIDVAYLVDRQYAAIQTIKENITVTKAASQFIVWKMPAQKALEKLTVAKEKFDLVLLDPPYAQQEILKLLDYLVASELLNQDALVLCETDNQVVYPEYIQHYQTKRLQNYGLTQVAIFQYKGESS